jgi:hypothetical protein
LHPDEPPQQLVAFELLADPQRDHPVDILLRGAQPVDADTEATTTTSRRVSSELVAECRSRSTSSLIEESFSM